MAPIEAESVADARPKVGLISRLRGEFDFIRGNFLILVLSWILMDFAREIPATYYGLYVRELGGSPATVGLIAFVAMVAQSLVQFPGGYLADKYGRKWLISSMAFGAAASYIIYALAPNWQTVLVGAVIHSLCMIYGPALNAIIADSLPSEKRGMGFSIMNLINSVSTTPAPLVAGWLFTKIGLVPSTRIGYGLVAAAFFIAGIFRLRLEETLREPRKMDRRELIRAFPDSIGEGIRVWKQLPRSALALFVTNILGGFGSSLFQPILVFWIVDDLGISEVQWAFIMTTLFVSMIAFSIPIGKLIDKAGKRRPLLFAYLCWIVLVPLFMYGDFYRILVAMPMVGVMQIIMMAASSALMADLVPREHRGKAAGSMGFFTLLAAAFGQLAGGYMYENISHAMPWYAQLIFVAPIIVITALYVREPGKEKGEREGLQG